MKNFPLSVLCISAALALTGCATSTSTNSYAHARESFEVQDYKTAFAEVQTPAAEGNAEAEYALGYMYYYGKGTEANQELGKKWIARSAAQGYDTALQAYQMILGREETGSAAVQQTANSISTPTVAANKVTAAPTQTIAHLPATTPTPALVVPEKTSLTSYTAEETALLKISATHYTIQLSVVDSSAAATAFIQAHHLAGQTQVFRRKLNDKVDYVVIDGNFSNRNAATLAIKKLPKKIQALHPWARSYGDVHKQVQTLS